MQIITRLREFFLKVFAKYELKAPNRLCNQALYFIKTEIIDAPYLDANPAIQTSLRWLALDHDRPVHKVVLAAVRRMGYMSAAETFDPTTNKTKIIFMASQLVYTALTLLPVPLLYRFRSASVLLVVAVFSLVVFNGGE